MNAPVLPIPSLGRMGREGRKEGGRRKGGKRREGEGKEGRGGKEKGGREGREGRVKEREGV